MLGWHLKNLSAFSTSFSVHWRSKYCSTMYLRIMRAVRRRWRQGQLHVDWTTPHAIVHQALVLGILLVAGTKLSICHELGGRWVTASGG